MEGSVEVDRVWNGSAVNQVKGVGIKGILVHLVALMRILKMMRKSLD